MSFRLRIVALACTLPLTLVACSAASDPEPTASLERIVTDPKATTTAEAAPATTEIGGAATAQVLEQTAVVSGLDAPWDVEVTTDGSVLITERDSALIKRVRAGVATTLNGPGSKALQSMVNAKGEGGLLGIAVLPGDTTYLYAYITRDDDNAVLRMEMHDDLLSLPTVILEGIPAAANHDGGRIAFGPDGYLYVGTGDAGRPAAATKSGNLAGKSLRIVADGSDQDGKAAPGNPWGNRAWTLGHRNVEGFAWVADGRMYASEFGQDAWDELNLIEAGGDYGWPATEGFDGDGSDAITFPVEVWDPDEASPSGVAITHEGIYVASLKGERLWRIPLTESGTGEPHVILDGEGRIRDVAAASDGTLWVVTNNTDGRGTPRDGDDRLLHLTVG